MLDRIQTTPLVFIMFWVIAVLQNSKFCDALAILTFVSEVFMIKLNALARKRLNTLNK